MKRVPIQLSWFALLGLLFLSACAGPLQDAPEASVTAVPTETVDSARDFEIVTLLPRDAIPAIDNPVFLTKEAAEEEYNDGELVMGVVIDGDARAYSVGLLSNHEIVNDTVGGQKIAVTW